jgi:hypothetical protein
VVAVACGSCDTPIATAHIQTQSLFGRESCAICHGLDDELAVDRVHLVR